MNILKVTSRMSCGADRTTLLRLYHCLIRSVLDYASIVYDGALDSIKQPLDSVHHACLRTATGAFRTSRRASLLVDAEEVPLHLRRKRLALLYACKIKQNPDHPTYDWIFDQSRGGPSLHWAIGQEIATKCYQIDVTGVAILHVLCHGTGVASHREVRVTIGLDLLCSGIMTHSYIT